MGDELEFKVSSGLKNIIGKDLITDDFIAVFELVKNSYDAQAKNVEITIESDKIVISDDGKGMSLSDLKNKWLFVAYSAKKDNTEDLTDNKTDSYRDKIQERTHYAGAKGIGRFSSDRLGQFLTIITKKETESSFEKIDIDWSKFEVNQNDIFETIKVNHDTISSSELLFPKKSKKGTILEISGLHNNWSRERLKQLKHSLEKLINPFSEKNDFNIEIICTREIEEDNKIENGKAKYIDRDKINGKVKNSILEILNIKTTQISVEINSEEIITKIIDRGTPIYHIKEKNRDFSLLTNAKIDLYFLNSSAKNNFTRKMGVQVVNFGSVFLFKNGFRVQPFGEVGDDSWGLDYRAQQGYNRFLGTRDLFGKVEMLTNNSEQFKEVSSRDGGLVETIGYHQLMNAFKEKGLVRLERYVVGVLWGEGFKKRKYFGEGNDANKIAESYRDKLKSDDKVSDNTSAVESNLGSKLDFIQIVKSLTTNKEIEVLNFNKDFVNLVNERIDEYQTKFITDLETIAEQTNDEDLKEKILEIEKQYQELKKEKEEAERRALEEEKKRIEAEEKAEKEEKARKEAERKAEKEEEKRRKAELATLKKEKERAEAEVAKLKAEKKAKEEAEKRKKEEEARKKAENEAARRKEQLTRHKAAETVEYKDLRDSNHIIGVYSDDISKKILLLKRKLDKGKKLSDKELFSFIQGISLANEKIATLTRFTTKSNFLKASLETTENIVSYIINYIEKTYLVLYKIDVEILNRDTSFIKKFQPIELSVVIDNILSNSRKKNAKKIIFDFNVIGDSLEISIRDVGLPLSNTMDPSLIFEEGMTTTRGSGLGLNHVKRIVEDDLNGSIVYNPEYTKGFELKIILKK
tara:strand:- start:1719 stop:4304 length:2586 start_codon:yes stop_codon:yes gene_type:complete